MKFEEFVARKMLAGPNSPNGGSVSPDGSQSDPGGDLSALPDVQGAAVEIHSDGQDVSYDVHRKLDLGFCFGYLAEEAALNNLDDATIIEIANEVAREWEFAGDINFIHRAEKDHTDGDWGSHGACCPPMPAGVPPSCTSATDAFFRIRVADQTECPLGDCSAFVNWLGREVPSMPNTPRELGIGLVSLQSEEALRSTLRHEFGHVLGLVHEHERKSQDLGSCLDAATFEELTDYDSRSVMSYDFCNSTDGTHDDLTVRDRTGIAYLYNLPHKVTNTDYGNTPGSAVATRDIFWFTPDYGTYTVWLGTPGASISFGATTGCFASPGCAGLSGNIKPFDLTTSSDGLEDIFFYGPYSASPDRLLHSQNLGAFATYNKSVNPSRLVPSVVPAHAASSDDILWYGPGTVTDSIWHPSTATTFSATLFTEDTFRFPISGRFGDDDWQTFMYRPASRSSSIWTWDDHDKTSASSDNTSLNSDFGYIPLVGEFSDDVLGLEDIAWYAPLADEDRLVLWETVPAEAGGIWTFDDGVPRSAKPIVGAFDDDEFDDILFYSTDGEWLHQLWKFQSGDPSADIEFSLPPIDGDFSPVVGDFNGDGCDDILWFAPHIGTSPLWRSDCDGDFVEELPVVPPSGAYPVGYGIGYGRK